MDTFSDTCMQLDRMTDRQTERKTDNTDRQTDNIDRQACMQAHKQAVQNKHTGNYKIICFSLHLIIIILIKNIN